MSTIFDAISNDKPSDYDVAHAALCDGSSVTPEKVQALSACYTSDVWLLDQVLRKGVGSTMNDLVKDVKILTETLLTIWADQREANMRKGLLSIGPTALKAKLIEKGIPLSTWDLQAPDTNPQILHLHAEHPIAFEAVTLQLADPEAPVELYLAGIPHPYVRSSDPESGMQTFCPITPSLLFPGQTVQVSVLRGAGPPVQGVVTGYPLGTKQYQDLIKTLIG